MRATIVGGGLAGAVTGLWLQSRGIEARILEQRKTPGSTLCGEGVALRTLAALEPVFDASPYIASRLPGATWQFPGTKVEVHESCATMDRDAWIPAMLDAFQARGGIIEYGTRVTRRMLTNNRPAGVLIGCDGPGSQVRALVPGAQVKLRLGLQVTAPYEAEALCFWTDKRWSNEYAWAFPRGETTNIGILGEGDGKDQARLGAFMAHLGLEVPDTSQSFPIAYEGTRDGTPDGQTILMGDAAGITNPVTKGGIAAILHSAPLLADALAAGAPQRYVQLMRSHPLRHPSYVRAARRLRAYDNKGLSRTLRTLPKTLHLGGRAGLTRSDAARHGAKIVARQPSRAADAWTFFQAARHSARWSW